MGERYLWWLLMVLLMFVVMFPLIDEWMVRACYGDSAWASGLRVVRTKHDGVVLSNGKPMQGDPLGWFWMSRLLVPLLSFALSRCLVEAQWHYRHTWRNRAPGYSKRRDL